MKVGKLISILKKYDPDMQVFTYNSLDEGDGLVTGVKVVSAPEDMFYSQGDSYVEDYLSRRDKPVLVIHDCTDF